jgi:pyruvate formate lyase activating enzyme
MKISGLQKVSLVDYDGQIASTIFTSGCNFACPFCHNAGLVKGTEPDIPTSEILGYLTKRKNVLTAVCISGGEPTLHKDLPELISKIKELGYLVKLDTNGTNLEMLKYLVENQLIDYIAMDIKNSFENYTKTIGINHPINIKDTIDYVMNCGIDYEFRTTIIKHYHTKEDIEKISKNIKGAKKYFLQKFVDNNNCLTKGLEEIDTNTAQEYLKICLKNIPNTKLRGY